jgi:hypothetical protein
MPCCTQYPHPLRMDYIYYKPNEQDLHLIGLAHSMAMLEHLSNTFIILIMKYSHNNFNEKCNIIFLYNYSAHFHERTPWCINWLVYVRIANFWSFLVYGWVFHNTRRKTCIFDCSLRLNFSRKRHFATKILLIA